MVVKKLFDKNFDEEVHSDFLKFGRGEYKDKYLLEGKKSAKGWTIKAGPEYVNYLVAKCLGKVSGSLKVSGIIVSTLDLKGDIGFEIKKTSNFQGIRKNVIDTEVTPREVLDMMEKFPRVFYALSFSGKDFILKVKAKAPKSSKPGKESEDGPRPEFCTLKTEDKSIVEDLFFDFPEFKEISVNHLISVRDIVYPKNMKELKPAEVREQAKRKGIIFRKVIVDGVEKKSEAEFVA